MSAPVDKTAIETWAPEDPDFWAREGQGIARRTLWITTFNLTLSFITWFAVSALVVRLPNVGFSLSRSELFGLAAMPGLAGGTLRIVHTFLIPLYGSRRVVSLSTLSLALPLVGWTFAVQRPDTPYWVLLVLAALAGLGGGNFSSFMPSTSLFFPKRKLGAALGIQAGIGNFGVSVVQFITPWIIAFPLFGSAFGGPLVFTKGDATTPLWLQNATLVWAPFVVAGAVLAGIQLRSVPVKANVREQLDIFRDKHTWVMTSLYLMTFGSFSGLSAAFPLLIRTVYGKFPGAPDPLAYAFLGPLVGSLARIAAGPLSDRFRGSVLTQVSGLGLTLSALVLTRFMAPSSLSDFSVFVGLMLSLFFFAGVGNASTFKQMPMIFPPRKASGVIGWTAAVAAYGPFLFSILVDAAMGATGSGAPVFYGLAAFCALNLAANYWFYMKKGAERPC
jgi:MFS transporter, NNP family, nitrate/nitrite transporter